MDEKIKITAELGKEKISALFYLLGEELTPERWKVLSEAPILLNLETLDKEDRRNTELLLVSLAIATTKLE
jgi:hypothetical protein